MTEEAKDLVAKDPDLTPGTVVGEYKVEATLGSGGFGTVYRAVHPLIGKTAAIKVLHRQFSANVEMVERFVAEARAVNQIRHRGIIDVFSFGTLPDGRQYYVMELLEGATLDALLQQKGRLDVEQTITILRGIARALDAAHAAGIAHRDLKPENVFVTFDDDGRPVPKLLDFGIAKLMGERTGVRTQTGTPIGTPKYMSPEQARGVGVDARTDIYSFGVLAFETLTGKVPFEGQAVMDILLKQITEVPPAPSSVDPAVPASLDAPILRMMSKDPADRPPTLSAAVDELAAAAGFSRASPTPSTQELASLVREHRQKNERALAATMAQVTGPTLVGSASEVGTSLPPPRRRQLKIAGVALASMLLGVGLVVVVRGSGGATAAASSASAPVVSASAPAKVEVPDVKKEIEITVRGAPEGAEIFLGAEKLGVAPGPVLLPRGSGSLALRVVAKGFASREVPIETDDDQTVVVSLDKVAAPAVTGPDHTVKKSGRAEYENPF